MNQALVQDVVSEVMRRLGSRGGNGHRRTGVRAGEEKAALIDEAANAGVGITTVDYALAESGTLVLLSNPDQPRSTSLLPPIHIAIVERTQLLRGLDDLFALLPR